jgi:membrane-anchored protein YejM (alkaline phosphatase superfamily)
MRNIVLIHLESLNYMHYQMNKELFPTLRKWEERSLSFSKYFSTATSTMMVLSDLAFGGILQNEPCDSVADGLRKYCYQESFLDNLKKKGYQVRIVGYPDDGFGDAAGCNQRNFIGYTVKLEEVESYET